MPMLDVYIPDGALSTEVEDHLVARLTDLLLTHEGVNPTNARASELAWVWVHRPARVFVAGKLADRPRYKLVPQVPEGQYDDQRRAAFSPTPRRLCSTPRSRWAAPATQTSCGCSPPRSPTAPGASPDRSCASATSPHSSSDRRRKASPTLN